jgi:CRISPR-associated protein Cmr5
MPDTTTITHIEQQRAKFAYECASDAQSKEFSKEYKAYVKKIPMLIKTNGLGATFTFVKAKANASNKGSGAYHLIYEQTTGWLQHDPKRLIHLSGDKDLVAEIIQLDSTPYRAVTVEILAFFGWLRRFAEGLIEGEAEDA